MGLSIVVGIMSDVAETDEEAVEHYREEFARLNEVLAEQGLPQHSEPEKLPPVENRCSLDGFPYSFLHTVRRAYAHRIRDPQWIAEPRDDDAADDPLVEEVTMEMESHLLCHSDAEGFYLPLDFASVVFDEDQERITGGMLGSSYRLKEELEYVAPALGIKTSAGELADDEAQRINDLMEREGPLWIEQIVWLALYEAARLSIKHRAAICFN
jgi:hypothetical protein